MALDSFFDRPMTRVVTSAGDSELPVLYRDASAVFAFFRVDAARAAELLGHVPLEPVRLGRRSAIAAVAAYDYRDTSIGPYRELGVALAAVPRHATTPALPLVHLLRARTHEDVGWHVIDLPVTTAIADVGGRELYGFPKFVTEVAVEVTNGIHVAVNAPAGEEPILGLEGEGGPGLVVPAMDLVMYTLRNGELIRSLVEQRGWMHTGLGRGVALHVGAAEHPMAERLRALGLDGDRPFATQVCRHLRLVLGVGAPFRAAARAA